MVSCAPVEATEEQDELGSWVPERRLNNSEMLATLDSQFDHLTTSEKTTKKLI